MNNTQTQYLPIKRFNKFFKKDVKKGRCSEGHREQSHFNLYFRLLKNTIIDGEIDEKVEINGKEYAKKVEISKSIINEMMTHFGDKIFTMNDVFPLVEYTDPKLRIFNRRTPILNMMCRYSHSVELIEWFLKIGANPNVTDDDGFTPLMIASDNCKNRRTEFSEDDTIRVTKILLEKGANPYIKDRNGDNGFDYLRDIEDDELEDFLNKIEQSVKIFSNSLEKI
jgi:ankyrin repeat protein